MILHIINTLLFWVFAFLASFFITSYILLKKKYSNLELENKSLDDRVERYNEADFLLRSENDALKDKIILSDYILNDELKLAIKRHIFLSKNINKVSSIKKKNKITFLLGVSINNGSTQNEMIIAMSKAFYLYNKDEVRL
jgi:hypothetical protein